MVKITIIGWYGTETIGDRAILAGLFRLFSEKHRDYEVKLGAIYPFYSEKTLLEDEGFLKACAGKDKLAVSVFDTMSPRALREAIRMSDAVVIGGGPLYDSPAMFMLEYAMKFARKHQKRTLILGCGIGPLYRNIYRKTLVQILMNTDTCIFRDRVSEQECFCLTGRTDRVYSAIDPAVLALSFFAESVPVDPVEECIAVAIRKYPGGFRLAPGVTEEGVDELVVGYLKQIQQQTGKEICMVPMNYCDSGGDDRKIMNQFRFRASGLRLQVQNEPLNTFQTMKFFQNSWGCVGMRFHSVVFQTFLNGNNLILDYTDPATGKIGNFLQQVKAAEHYKNSYVNLLEGQAKEMVFSSDRFEMDSQLIRDYESVYLKYSDI